MPNAQSPNLGQSTEWAFGSIDIVCPGAGVFEEPSSNFWIPPGKVGPSPLPKHG